MKVNATGQEAPVTLARAFLPEIRARADEIEATRHLPQDLAEKFAAGGLYRLCIPTNYGGLEAHPRTFFETVECLAEADGSAAWCVFIGATSGMTSAFLAPDQARAIFGETSSIVAGVFAPRGTARRTVKNGEDGYIVSGRWQWGSGSRNAHFIMGGALILDEAGKPEMLDGGMPENRMMIFSANDVTIHDTWHVSGLCGTGSNDFEVRECFVPAHLSVSLLTDTPLDRPLYAFPTFGLLGIGIAGVALGLARGAINEVISFAAEKTPQGSFKPLATRASTQIHIARAEAHVRSARAWLIDTIETAWQSASHSGKISIGERRDIRLATTHATHAAAKAVDLMYNLGGGTSVYRKSPLQRQFRDVHVATQHMMVAEPTLELAGRLFLDMPTNTAML